MGSAQPGFPRPFRQKKFPSNQLTVDRHDLDELKSFLIVLGYIVCRAAF